MILITKTNGWVKNSRAAQVPPQLFLINEVNCDKTDRLAERILSTSGDRFIITPISVLDHVNDGHGEGRNNESPTRSDDFKLAEHLAGVIGNK